MFTHMNLNMKIAKCLTGRVTLLCPAKTDLGYNSMQLAVSVTDALHFRRKPSFDSKPNVIESPMLDWGGLLSFVPFHSYQVVWHFGET